MFTANTYNNKIQEDTLDILKTIERKALFKIYSRKAD